MTISGCEPPKPGAVLHELTSARTPWLALTPAGSARHDGCTRTMSDVTVVDLADPRVPPVMVSPFEPEPGFPIQAHAGRLAGLFEAVFGLTDPAGVVMRAGLGRAYAECGWDARTGAAPPGARTAPGIPALAQLTRATLTVAAVAGRMLDETAAPFRAGPVWVIPQLRWLHELDRLNPLVGTPPRLDDIAPPLDFGLAGLPDWPGIRVRDRLGALERHPLSMASPRNRRLACTALLGEDGRAGFDTDLDAVTLGIHPGARLRHAALLMGIGPRGPEPGWLEVVLSWPDRIIHSDLRPAATG